jgi:WD40 repeat protein
VQIWSIKSQLWEPVLTSTVRLDGKIRSLSWHPSFLLLGIAGIKFRFAVIDGNRNWTSAEVEARSSTIPRVTDTYVHFLDWSPTNAFVVDTTVYEIVPPKNIFNTDPTSAPPIASRAIAVLDACRLCTLSQWSPDGQFIATAFGNEISISQVKATTDAQQDVTGQFTNWELIHNLTTVTDTYMIITSMEWSPNGEYLAVGGAGNNNLFVYNTNSWSDVPIMVPTSTEYGIDALAWRPDSQQIAIGTSRMVEIREIRLKEVDALPLQTPVSYNPTSAPSDNSALVTDPTSPPIKTGMRTAGMASIGIAAVVLSFSCVAIVFLQRLKFISKRKKKEKKARAEDHEIGALRDAENTMSEEDFEISSPIHSVIIVPGARNPSCDDDYIME